MRRALLMARENKLNIFLLAQNVEDFQNHAAGQTKDGFDPFVSAAIRRKFRLRSSSLQAPY